MALKNQTYTIEKFLGINESPDGDTGLELGEAADMVNFRITSEGNLQIRPGYIPACTLADGPPIRGMWRGYVNDVEVWLAACNGNVYSVDLASHSATAVGTITDAPTTFFPFSGKVYILNGHGYYSWDGTTFASVTGYVPIVTVAAVPATGTGASNEQVNKLIASYYIWYSGTDGTTKYQLPDKFLTSVDEVYSNGTLKAEVSDYTVNLTDGTVTFLTAPGVGTNNVKIRYTKNTADTAANRAIILSQLFAEAFNGYTDNRVFLYGDGTNKAYYSGLEYETGKPTVEYFPDMNVLDIGESNTPITAMIRQYNKFMAFKAGSTYIVEYGAITLSDGATTAGFYTRAIEKDIGNEAPGQVKLVNNYPISLTGNSVYRWGVTFSLGVQDERNAKRISDHVRGTLGGMDLSSAVTFDDEWNREFWIVQGGTAAIYQYANEAKGDTSYKYNVWYLYDNIPATCFVSIGGELYFGTKTGQIMHMSRKYHSDNGSGIPAYWESGSMSFDAMQIRKYIRQVFVGIKPESNARVTLTAESDTRSVYDEKIVSSPLTTFVHADFAHWSFLTNRKPRTKRLKFKIKKFTYCKLILKSTSASATVTVTAMALPVEYGSYAK